MNKTRAEHLEECKESVRIALKALKLVASHNPTLEAIKLIQDSGLPEEFNDKIQLFQSLGGFLISHSSGATFAKDWSQPEILEQLKIVGDGVRGGWIKPPSKFEPGVGSHEFLELFERMKPNLNAKLSELTRAKNLLEDLGFEFNQKTRKFTLKSNENGRGKPAEALNYIVHDICAKAIERSKDVEGLVSVMGKKEFLDMTVAHLKLFIDDPTLPAVTKSAIKNFKKRKMRNIRQNNA